MSTRDFYSSPIFFSKGLSSCLLDMVTGTGKDLMGYTDGCEGVREENTWISAAWDISLNMEVF